MQLWRAQHYQFLLEVVPQIEIPPPEAIVFMPWVVGLVITESLPASYTLERQVIRLEQME